MLQEHDITVDYNEDKLSATFTCPLCGKDWKFPFPAREIFEEPWPSPGTIVSLHLYGAGAKPTPCTEFESNSFVSCVKATDKFSVKLRLEQV